MSTRKDGPRRLRRFREERRISLREAAIALGGVSHVSVLAWELCKSTPSHEMRIAIERWTGGEVRADSWPLAKRERQISGRAADVKPFEPSADSGEHPAAHTPHRSSA